MKNLVLVAFFCIPIHSANNDTNSIASILAACQDKPTRFIAIAWPVAHAKIDLIETFLNDFCIILAKEQLHVPKTEQPNLIAAIYTKEQKLWCRHRLKHEIAERFPPDTDAQPLNVYLIELPPGSDAKAMHTTLRACKRTVRSLCAMSFYSLHIDDYHEEAINTAYALLTITDQIQPYSTEPEETVSNRLSPP